MANNFMPIRTMAFEFNVETACQTILSAVTNDVNKIMGKGSACGWRGKSLMPFSESAT
jgi:hypothetical protein